jgi:hypothetical protein
MLENEGLGQDNVAIRLFYNNPLVDDLTDENAVIEQMITYEQLLSENYFDAVCNLSGIFDAAVTVRYIAGVLHISTKDDVNIVLSSALPIKALNVSTIGWFGVAGDHTLQLEHGACIKAFGILLDSVVTADFLLLKTGKRATNTVKISKPVVSKHLKIDARGVIIAEKITTNKIDARFTTINIVENGELAVVEADIVRVASNEYNSSTPRLSPVTSSGSDDDEMSESAISAFRNYHQEELMWLNNLVNSQLNGDELVVKGALNLNKALLTLNKLFELGQNSQTSLENTIVEVDKFTCQPGSVTSGQDVQFISVARMILDGHIKIDTLSVNGQEIEVGSTGILDGVNRLQIKHQKHLHVLGKVTANKTLLDGETTVALYGGRIVGREVLENKSTMTAIACLGSLAGKNVQNKSGITINIFGLVNGYYSLNDALISIELGNAYVPYIECPNMQVPSFNEVKELLASYAKVPSRKNLYALMPSSKEAAWQSFASKYGIIRVLLSTVSIPAATGTNLIYQSGSLIYQLYKLKQKYQENPTEHNSSSAHDAISILLDLKGIIISSNALKQSAIRAHTMYSGEAEELTQNKPEEESSELQQESNSSDSAGSASTKYQLLQETINNVYAQLPVNEVKDLADKVLNKINADPNVCIDLFSLFLPSSQRDSLFAMDYGLSIAGTQSSQNIFSLSGGRSFAINRFDQSAVDQVDHGVRYAYNMVVDCYGKRYQYGGLYSANLNYRAKNSYISRDGRIVGANTSSVYISGKLASEGYVHLVNGAFVVDGAAELANVYTKNVRSQFGSLSRTGFWRYDGDLSIRTGHSASELHTSLYGSNDSNYVLVADSISHPGSENHEQANFNIANLSAQQVEEFLSGTGMHSNKQFSKLLRIATETGEPIKIFDLKNSADVMYGLTTNGAVSIDSNLKVAGLEIESKNEGINVRAGIESSGSVLMKAKKDILKPAVKVESLHGDVALYAGDRLDNSSGGEVHASQGNALLVGRSVDLRSHDINRRTSAKGKMILVESTDGDVYCTYSYLDAEEYIQLQATNGKVIIDGLSRDVPDQHDTRREYFPTEIKGGRGNAFSNGFGAKIDADLGVDLKVATIGSAAKTSVHGRDYASATAEYKIYKSQDQKFSHGSTRDYYRNQDVTWGTVSLYGGSVYFGSESGPVDLVSVNFFTEDGGSIYARAGISQTLATVQLLQEHDHVHHGRERRNRYHHTRECPSVFRTNGGEILYKSTHEGIFVRGVNYLNANPYENTTLVFDAMKDVDVAHNVLQHTITESSKFGFRFGVAGHTLIGERKRKKNVVDMLGGFDPTVGSADSFVNSSNALEAAINGYSTIGSLDRLVTSIQENGVVGALKERTNAQATIKLKSKTTFMFETEGTGGFFGGYDIIMRSQEGLVRLGYNIDNIRSNLSVIAGKFFAGSAGLKFKVQTSTQSVSVSQSLSGEQEVGVSASWSRTTGTTHAQRVFNLNTLHLDVADAVLQGVQADCDTFVNKGKVTIVHATNTAKSKNASISLNSSGTGSVGYGQSEEVTVGARSSLNVRGNGSNSETGNVHHVDAAVSNQRRGLSVGGLAFGESKPGSINMISVAPDYQNTRGVMTQGGLHMERENRVKAALLHHYRTPGSNQVSLHELTSDANDNIPVELRGDQYPYSPAPKRHGSSMLEFSPTSNSERAPAQMLSQAPTQTKPNLAKEKPRYVTKDSGVGSVNTNLSSHADRKPDVKKSIVKDQSSATITQKNGSSKKDLSDQLFTDDLDLPLDWWLEDAYSEANLKRSVDNFMKNPMNIARKKPHSSQETFALTLAGSTLGRAIVPLDYVLETLSFIESTELPSLMTTGYSPNNGRKFLETVEHGQGFLNELFSHGPKILWTNYKDGFKEQMQTANEFERSGNPFMASFTASRATARAALDGVTLLGSGGVAVGGAYKVSRLGSNVVRKYASKQLPVKHNFINESKLLEHFEKHGGEFKGAYKTPEEYLQGANFVIEHGHKVKYEYMGKERIGYVRFMGNARNLSVDDAIKNFSKRAMGLSKYHEFGEAKFEFLALRDDGAIATYHTQGAENFYRTLNKNSKNSTVDVEHLSCRMM